MAFHSARARASRVSNKAIQRHLKGLDDKDQTYKGKVRFKRSGVGMAPDMLCESVMFKSNCARGANTISKSHAPAKSGEGPQAKGKKEKKGA